MKVLAGARRQKIIAKTKPSGLGHRGYHSQKPNETIPENHLQSHARANACRCRAPVLLGVHLVHRLLAVEVSMDDVECQSRATNHALRRLSSLVSSEPPGRREMTGYFLLNRKSQITNYDRTEEMTSETIRLV